LNNNCGKLTHKGTMDSGFIVACTESDSHRVCSNYVYKHLIYIS